MGNGGSSLLRDVAAPLAWPGLPSRDHRTFSKTALQEDIALLGLEVPCPDLSNTVNPPPSKSFLDVSRILKPALRLLKCCSSAGLTEPQLEKASRLGRLPRSSHVCGRAQPKLAFPAQSAGRGCCSPNFLERLDSLHPGSWPSGPRLALKSKEGQEVSNGVVIC